MPFLCPLSTLRAWGCLCVPSGSFWRPLGCFIHPFGILLASFWDPCVHLDVTWDYFSTQVGTIGLLFEARIVGLVLDTEYISKCCESMVYQALETSRTRKRLQSECCFKKTDSLGNLSSWHPVGLHLRPFWQPFGDQFLKSCAQERSGQQKVTAKGQVRVARAIKCGRSSRSCCKLYGNCRKSHQNQVKSGCKVYLSDKTYD